MTIFKNKKQTRPFMNYNLCFVKHLNCSLSELVQHNKNGLTFENSHQLYSYLTSWFGDYSKHEEQCAQFKQEMKKFTDLDWHTSWKKNVSYMFL